MKRLLEDLLFFCIGYKVGEGKEPRNNTLFTGFIRGLIFAWFVCLVGFADRIIDVANLYLSTAITQDHVYVVSVLLGMISPFMGGKERSVNK